MLLTHPKMALGNNISYMSSYNYFSAVPMILLMELKIINDADQYLDNYIEMVRMYDDSGILYTDSIFDNPENLKIFGEYLWLQFISEYSKMNDYQKSYCFWRFLEYTEVNIENALEYSFKEIGEVEDYNINISDDSLINLSKIYGSESRKLREKYLKRYLTYPKVEKVIYPKLEGNSIQRFKELYDFHFEYFKKGVYYSKEETHFKLTVQYNVLSEPILGDYRGIFENNSGVLWQVSGNNFIQSKINIDIDHEKITCKRHDVRIFNSGKIPKEIYPEDVSIVFFNPEESCIMEVLKQQIQTKKYVRINNNYYNTSNQTSIDVSYTYDTYDTSFISSYNDSTFSSTYRTINEVLDYGSTFSNSISLHDDYADTLRYRDPSRYNLYQNRIKRKEKTKKKTRKIDSKFIKSYTFLTKILSLDHIKQMRKNGIIIEGQYFNYFFKVKDKELISKSKYLDNASIAYDLFVLAKDTGEKLTSLCIVYPGMPICDEISTNILFIRSGEEDTLLAKANHLSRSENYNLYFEDKKRISPERRFEIEFKRLLEEEAQENESEDNSMVSFFNNMDNSIVRNESVREKFKKERFKKLQTVSFINKFLQREYGFEDVNYNPYTIKYYYLYKEYIKHFKPKSRVRVGEVFKFKENGLFKEIIQKNKKALKLSFKRMVRSKIRSIKNKKTRISLKGKNRWKLLRNAKFFMRKKETVSQEEFLITNYQRQNVSS